MDCIFCRIIRGELPSKMHYSSDNWVVIEDINPQARHHLLIISRKHIPSFSAMENGDLHLLRGLNTVVNKVSAKLDFASYQLLTNNGAAAGQTVMHLHWHLLSNDEG